MKRPRLWSGTIVFLVVVAAVAVERAAVGASVTGREALATVRHDWKDHAHAAVHTRARSLLPVPANYAHLSPEARLAFLHARRALDPVRFDHYHPGMGLILANDDRMKAAQSQNCLLMNGILPDNSLTRYLQFRRGLDPGRFDLYHPTLGTILVEDHKLKTGVNCVASQFIPPPLPPTRPPGAPGPSPPIGGPPPLRVVPEPGTLGLTFLGAACLLIPAAMRKRRTRRQR